METGREEVLKAGLWCGSDIWPTGSRGVERETLEKVRKPKVKKSRLKKKRRKN